MACQIRDFLPFFTSSLPPFLLSSILPFFLCFWDLSGAYCGGRQGAIPRPTTRPDPTPTILQLRLKIALFFDAVFLPFWVDLVSQDGSKIHRNPSKIVFKIALDFNLFSTPLFKDFRWIFDPHGYQKCTENFWGLIVFTLLLFFTSAPFWSRF